MLSPQALSALERAIACEAARSDIECNCQMVEFGPPSWYDLISATPEIRADWIDRAVTYLDARGLLLRHPTNPDWVAIKESA